jgi:hypothetical protein
MHEAQREILHQLLDEWAKYLVEDFASSLSDDAV